MHILVVEDEHRLAALLRRVLSAERHVVDIGRDSPSGLEHASSDSYDLLILDLMLPGMDGLDVCRALREGNIWVPILMLTARGAVEDRVAGLDVGAGDDLVKPFAMRELLARVRVLLELLVLVGLITLLGSAVGGIVLSHHALAPARLAFARQQALAGLRCSCLTVFTSRRRCAIMEAPGDSWRHASPVARPALPPPCPRPAFLRCAAPPTLVSAHGPVLVAQPHGRSVLLKRTRPAGQSLLSGAAWRWRVKGGSSVPASSDVTRGAFQAS